MMQAANTWRKWIPIVVMVSWIYVGSNLLQNATSAAVNYILLGGTIGVTEVLIGQSIATQQLFPFAAGLIFIGTLLSSIPLFHAGSVSLPPDHWKIAVALAGSTALLFSPRIKRMIRHLSIFHGLEFLHGKPESILGPTSRGDVQIRIRLDRTFDFLRGLDAR